MTPRHVLAGAFVSLLLAIIASEAFAQVESKRFVLRNHEVGNCWTAVLIPIDGQYINTFERKAGGPYRTEEEALERQRDLERQGSCQQQPQF